MTNLVVKMLTMLFLTTANHTNLPDSIVHSIERGIHIYTIQGLLAQNYKESHSNKGLLEIDEEYPNIENIEIDLVQMTLRITAIEKIKDLQSVIDKISLRTMLIPLWDEYACLGQKDDEFEQDLYSLVFQDTLTTKGCPLSVIHSFDRIADGEYKIIGSSASLLEEVYRAHSKILNYKGGEYILQSTCDTTETDQDSKVKAFEKNYPAWDDTIEIRYSSESEGYIAFNKYTEFCMCGAYRYAMRLYTTENTYIWVDYENIYSAPLTYCIDLNSDGIDEIIVLRSDHGRSFILIYEHRAARSSKRN